MIKVWTKLEIVQAIELRLQEKPWAEIAAALGRSESSLWVKLSKWGIKLRADGGNRSAVRENLAKLRLQLIEEAQEEAVAATEQKEAPAAAPNLEAIPPKTLAETTVEEDIEETRRRILMSEARESKRKYQEILARAGVGRSAGRRLPGPPAGLPPHGAAS